MFYAKNLPPVQRWARTLIGAGVIGMGLWMGNVVTLGWLIAGSGGVLALTGFVGFCPLCAMVGRKRR